MFKCFCKYGENFLLQNYTITHLYFKNVKVCINIFSFPTNKTFLMFTSVKVTLSVKLERSFVTLTFYLSSELGLATQKAELWVAILCLRSSAFDDRINCFHWTRILTFVPYISWVKNINIHLSKIWSTHKCTQK